jgi:ribosomal protein S18 acetylase RimI-like enzyme
MCAAGVLGAVACTCRAELLQATRPSMSNVCIRPVEATELPAVVELVNSAYRGDSSRRGWTTEADLLGGQRTDVETLGAQLRAAGAIVLVAQRDDRLAGCVFLERAAAAEAYLGMLTVDPRGQTTGLGSALLAAAERYVREMFGAVAIRMTVIAQRVELIAWYERRGYARTGETQPFPYGDANFGLPKRDDLYFIVLRKPLATT